MKISISVLFHVKKFKRQKLAVKSKSTNNLSISLAVSENLDIIIINKIFEIGLYSQFCVVVLSTWVYDSIFKYRFICKIYFGKVLIGELRNHQINSHRKNTFEIPQLK